MNKISIFDDTRLMKVIHIFIGFLAVFFLLQFFYQSSISEQKNELEIAKKPTTTREILGVGEKFGEYTLFSLPADLNKAQIHDIIFYSGAMWLGTDKGLVKIKDQKITIYKQFSDWPFEWVRDLVATPFGIVVQAHVAIGNTGGSSAGSHIFNIEEETWAKVGTNVLAQTWLDGYLYQASSTLIRRKPSKLWEKEILLASVCNRRPSSLKMKAIKNEIWLTGDGTTLQNYVDNSFGCGVIRYNPSSGQSTIYKRQDGLNHDKGWDLGGDNEGVFVSHSVKHNRLSYYDFEEQQWHSMTTGGSGNRITVSPQAIWLAEGTPRRPLRRIDRKNQKGVSFSAFSENEYVSAIGVNNQEVWFGIYETHWSDSKYSITSRLGLYVEK